MECVNGRGLEVEAHVELPCFFVQRMYKHRAHCNDVGCGRGAKQRVLQESTPETRAFLRLIDREPGQEDDADWLIRCASRDSVGRVLPIDTAGGQRLVADGPMVAMYNIRRRQIALLIDTREAL